MTKELSKVVKGMSKEYGDIIKGLGNLPEVPRFPVESPKIGDILGEGGIPQGRVIELYGPESGGKTTIAYYLCGQIQKTKIRYIDKNNREIERMGQVAFIDAEHAVDPTYARVQGFDINESVFVQPDYGEQALDIAIKLAESGEVDFIVVDSVASLVPLAELEAGMSEQQMGLQARLLGKAMRKLVGVLHKKNCTLLLINQVRMKIGVMFGNPECVTPDTLIDVENGKKLFVEEIFEKAELDWRTFEEGDIVDISDKNIEVKSVNPNTREIEYKKVLNLVRKEDTQIVYVKSARKKNKILFKASPAHKVYAFVGGEWGYFPLDQLQPRFIGINDMGNPVELVIEKSDEMSPILDFEVEKNRNYFANGILSHNTTPGGKAIKFHASIRLEVRKVEWIIENKVPIGLLVRLKGVKNKTAPPMRVQELEISFTKGIESKKEWVDFAVETEVITKAGSWYSYNGQQIGQGKDRVVAFLEENPDIYATVISETRIRKFPTAKDVEVVEVKERSDAEMEEFKKKQEKAVEEFEKGVEE